MILGPVVLVDCLVFILFLIPQLFYQAGIISTLTLVLKVLPFLLFQLPYRFVHERYRSSPNDRSPFCRNATIFQDIVVRCVRYAFANIPASVGRTFFSKWVAHPFLRFRLLRHGYLHSPIFYQEVVRRDVKGLWIIPDEKSDPDLIIYYCHGGGFSMGSGYFYLEFLMAWLTRLKDRGYRNPACFALEYTLVPDAKSPTQLNETRAGYQLLLNMFGQQNANKICISGDSAGATLGLSMLLYDGSGEHDSQLAKRLERPGLAVLLSPWTHLISDLNQNTPSDYLDKDSLHLYAQQYAGRRASSDEVLSPGLCVGKWKQVEPLSGFRILYGSEEVFAPGIEEMTAQMRKDGVLVKTLKEDAKIHAWPVVNLFLGATREERLTGLDIMTDCVLSSIEPSAREVTATVDIWVPE